EARLEREHQGHSPPPRQLVEAIDQSQTQGDHPKARLVCRRLRVGRDGLRLHLTPADRPEDSQRAEAPPELVVTFQLEQERGAIAEDGVERPIASELLVDVWRVGAELEFERAVDLF